MVSKLVLLANLLGLFLIDAFLLADVRITQTIPTSMTAGTDVRVSVTVEKGELSGFAKFQLDLPAGLSVTAIETKGASFTFADGKAKFIWMALPPGPNFKFSYTLSADASATGILPIAGRLSYIEDNERKTYELPPSTIELSGSTAVTTTHSSTEESGPDGSMGTGEQPAEGQEPAHTVTIPATTDYDLVSAAGGAPASPAGKVPVVIVDNAHGTAPIQGQGGVMANRTITPVSDKEMIVEVVVKKGSFRGFGKLQETIPPGFIALEKNSDEAIFTAQESIVKFVWLNLPAREEVKVVYKLKATTQPDGEYLVDGEFGYLLNDETQKAVVGSSRFFIGPKALELMAADQSNVENLGGQDPALTLNIQPTKEEPASTATPPVRKEGSSKPVEKTQTTARASVPSPEKGVVYKVQITAAHREVGKAYFVARHKYNGDFQLERHQGWIKYVTGGYTTYKEARDQRVAYLQGGHDFPGPFVTAYNNGERITVQEALMITKQQWFQ